MARSIYCYTCGEVKENPKLGYCRPCQRVRDKANRIKNGTTLRNRTGLCRCGKPFASYSNCYCRECASKWKREYLNKNPDKKARMNKDSLLKRKADANERFKYHSRQMARNAIRSGMIQKQPCEVCGIDNDVEAHHDDYSKPLDIRWLCTKHHAEHHTNIKD